MRGTWSIGRRQPIKSKGRNTRTDATSAQIPRPCVNFLEKRRTRGLSHGSLADAAPNAIARKDWEGVNLTFHLERESKEHLAS